VVSKEVEIATRHKENLALAKCAARLSIKEIKNIKVS